MEQGRMNVTEYERGTMRLFAARTGAKDVVTIIGSVLGGYYMLDHTQIMVPRLVTEIMDAGTKLRSKVTVRDALASRGISMSFSPGGDRTHFSATCLPEDISFVLTLIAECIDAALIPGPELAIQKKRTLAELDESKTKTRGLASQEFSRMVFDKNHVNYADTLASSIKQTERATKKDATAFTSLLGKGGLVLAITGDIVPDAVLTTAQKIFSKLPDGTKAMTIKSTNKKSPHAAESRVEVANKATIDVYMGVYVPLTYEDEAYIPFSVMTNMLGGRGLSGGHLMRTIRERDGLTYGIYASLMGFGGKADGAIEIWTMFPPDKYDYGVQRTKEEIQVFLKAGMTEKALIAKKAEMSGKYIVGLATSNGLASTLHSIGVREQPLSYLDEYPSLIQAVTIEDVKNAAGIVPWDAFSVAASGTFLKKNK